MNSLISGQNFSTVGDLSQKALEKSGIPIISLVKRAMEALVPFAAKYLCELGFSTLVTV
jgi:hypothetical protein